MNLPHIRNKMLLKNLKKLYVCACNQLNILFKIISIEKLDASGCTGLTDESFDSLKNLKELYVCECTQLKNPFNNLINRIHNHTTQPTIILLINFSKIYQLIHILF